MLEALRKSAKSPFAKALFVLLIISFGAWGIGDVLRGEHGHKAAITVGDIEVDSAQVRARFEQRLREIAQFVGPSFDAAAAHNMGLLDAVTSSMVAQASLDMAAKDLGLGVTDATLRTTVTTAPVFQKQQGGGFDRAFFQRFLTKHNLSEDQYVDLLRTDLVRMRLVNAATAGLVAPQSLAEALFKVHEERRIGEVVTIDPASIPPLTQTPSQDDLRHEYNDNIAAYTAPEYRKITVLSVTEGDLVDDVDVSDADMEAYYHQNADQYRIPPRRNVSQALVASEQEAKAIVKSVRGGQTLKDAAHAHGAKFTPLGPLTRNQLPPHIGNVVYALGLNKVSQPVKSTLGWHVFIVNSQIEAAQKPLSEVRDNVRRQIAADKAADALDNVAVKIKDALGGGETLEQVAAKLSLPLVSEKEVAADNRRPDGAPSALPAAMAKVILDQAFSLPVTEESLLTAAASGYFVVRVDAVEPSAQEPFDDVRDQLATAWEKKARAAKAQTMAKAMLKQARSGEDLAALAKKTKGASFSTTAAVTRDGRVQKGQPSPKAVTTAVFDLKKVGATAYWANEATVGLVKLISNIPAEPTARAVDQVADQLTNALSTELIDAVARAYAMRYNARINQDMIARAVHAVDPGL